MRQIFDSCAARARTDIDHHCHADDLWDRHEPTEGAAFDHHRTQATRGDQRPTSSRDASVTHLNPLRATIRHPPMFFVPVPAPASIPNTGGRNSLGRCRVNSRHLSQETEAATCGKLTFTRCWSRSEMLRPVTCRQASSDAIRSDPPNTLTQRRICGPAPASTVRFPRRAIGLPQKLCPT